MLNQIGVDELLEKVFLNKNKLIEENYFEDKSLYFHADEKAYQIFSQYLENNPKLESVNILLGVLATFAYGEAPEELKKLIKKIIIQNKDLIISNIDSLEETVKNTLNIDISSTLLNMIDMKISFALLNALNYSWSPYPLYKGKYFYGIQYLLEYLSEYCYDDFEKWFLSTESKNLKIIFINEVLSNNYHYEYRENELYIKSKINFMRCYSKMIFFTEKRLYFPNQKTIFDLEKNEENLYFIIFYINKYYHYLDEKNRDIFYNELIKLEEYLQYLTLSIFKEFSDKINLEVLYAIVNKIQDKELRDSLYEEILNHLNKDISSFDDISIDELDNATLYGKILSHIAKEEKIDEIQKKFNKIFNQLNEPYSFYKNDSKWKKSLKELLYYLQIISIFYSSRNKTTSLIPENKKKIKLVMKEFDFYHKKDFINFFEKIDDNIINFQN